MRGKSWWFKEGKNWAMSKANMLVIRFLTHPEQMIWVSMTPASVVDLCLRHPNWLRWTNLLEIVWNWRCSLIIFSKSFLIVFKRTIEWYDLGESYVDLLGLGIITIVDDLKRDGQYPNSIQVLAMSISLAIQSSSLMMSLIWLYVNLSGPGADELLHFPIVSINSFLVKEFHSSIGLLGISSKMWISISLVWAELKELCRVLQRSSSSIYKCPSYWIASITGSFCFLTQFISSHGLHFLLAISSILSLKKRHFVFLIMLLKLCQFSRLWYTWYLSRDS